MKHGFLRKITAGVSRPGSGGLTLLLFLVVLAPSVGLLWFMFRAVQNEELAYVQKVHEFYKGPLSFYTRELDQYWQTNWMQWQRTSTSAQTLFAELAGGIADSAICRDASGKIIYPESSVSAPPAPSLPGWVEAQRLEATDPAGAASAFGHLGGDATNETTAARAFQAQARCLLKARQTNAALHALVNLLQPRFDHATDEQGRLIAANAELMLVEATNAASQQFHHMEARLNDYGDSHLPAAQRRFLMHRLQQLFPDQAKFPLLAAEDLAAQYLESNPALPPVNSSPSPSPQPEWRPAALPDLWQFSAPGGQVILLSRTQSLRHPKTNALEPPYAQEDVDILVLAPGETSADAILFLPVGPTMPNWRVAFAWKDKQKMDLAAHGRIASLVWTGVLAVAGIIALGLFTAGLLRRQMAVAQLKNDLVANVTHELKTPLSSMRLLVDTLLNSPTLDEKTAREYLQLIARENLRLSHLIDNFLAFSRIERDKYSFDFRPVPSRQIIDNAVAAVRERFNVPGCRFAVAVPPSLPGVLADAGAMVTALLNLLDNAWKYSGDDKQIVLTAEARAGRVLFAVQDNGVGLPEGESSRIFQRFYQVDRRLSRTGSGCGLGLSIVQFIVTAHQGAVTVQSRPGAGSTFTIALPVADAPDAPEAAP